MWGPNINTNLVEPMEDEVNVLIQLRQQKKNDSGTS